VYGIWRQGEVTPDLGQKGSGENEGGDPNSAPVGPPPRRNSQESTKMHKERGTLFKKESALANGRKNFSENTQPLDVMVRHSNGRHSTVRDKREKKSQEASNLDHPTRSGLLIGKVARKQVLLRVGPGRALGRKGEQTVEGLEKGPTFWSKLNLRRKGTAFLDPPMRPGRRIGRPVMPVGKKDILQKEGTNWKRARPRKRGGNIFPTTSTEIKWGGPGDS